MAKLSVEESERLAMEALDKIILDGSYVPAQADVYALIGESVLSFLLRKEPVTRSSLLATLHEQLTRANKARDPEKQYDRQCLIIQAALKQVLQLPDNE